MMTQLRKLSVFLICTGLVLISFFSSLDGVENRIERKFACPKYLVVEGSFLDVRIEGENRQDVQVKGILEEVGREPGYEWVVEETLGELKVRLAAKGAPGYNIDGKVSILVPKHVQLKVANSSGDIWVGHMDSQDVSLRSASGKIKLLDCQGKFKVSAASGEVSASDLAGTIRLRTVSGDQHLQQLRGLITCRTTSGQIEGIGLKGDIEIESSCGLVALESIDGDLEVETKSGSVKLHDIDIEDEANVRTITGSLYLETRQSLDHYSMQLSSETGSVIRKGQNIGRKWRFEGSHKTFKMATTSGSIHLSN